MTFLTNEQVTKYLVHIEDLKLGIKPSEIPFPIEKAQKIIDEFIAIPEIIPASIEEIEQARKKICDNMSK